MNLPFLLKEKGEPLSSASFLLALLSGLLLALSFPKPGLSLLAWLCFVPLLCAADGATPRQSFRLGFITGFAAYSSIVYWLTIVMNSYGKLPLAVSLLLTMFMAAYLALYPATAMLLARAGERIGIPPVASFPIVFVGLEYLRSFALTGFPWASLGYSQYRTLPLIQIADLTGVYGVSLLVALVNVALYGIVKSVARGSSLTGSLKPAAAVLTLVAVTLWYGFERLTTPETGASLKVALIQGNISQDIKWNPAFQEETVAIYERLTRSVKSYLPDLVIWPESATPFFFQAEDAYAARLKTLVSELGAPLVFGSPAFRKESGDVRYLNSAFLLTPSGDTAGRSDKIHLVPFGEYVPLKRMLPFVNKLVEGIGDFAPGEAARPLDTGKASIGVLICYEGIFPELSRAYVNAGARLLVNISNDAWYKRSSAPYQHLSMTVFRAIENRVPLVRATNTGITAIIDSRGHFNGMTTLFKEAVLTGEVRLGSGNTLYSRFGDLFAAACLAFTLVIAILATCKNVKSEK